MYSYSNEVILVSSIHYSVLLMSDGGVFWSEPGPGQALFRPSPTLLLLKCVLTHWSRVLLLRRGGSDGELTPVSGGICSVGLLMSIVANMTVSQYNVTIFCCWCIINMGKLLLWWLVMVIVLLLMVFTIEANERVWPTIIVLIMCDDESWHLMTVLKNSSISDKWYDSGDDMICNETLVWYYLILVVQTIWPD